MDCLTRGQLAQRVGINIETVRFYEKEGLLSPANRTPSGYRQFGEGAIDRLKFVQRAKLLGFSLSEIRELLHLQDKDVKSCVEIRGRLQNKLIAVQAKKAELERLEAHLHSALRKCNRQLKHPGPQQTDGCPVFKQMAGAARPLPR